MRIAAIIQARMGSSRLPGKVLEPIEGLPVLQHVARRVLFCEGIAYVIIATTEQPEDDKIERWCDMNGFTCVRHTAKMPDGSNDVLGRFSFILDKYPHYNAFMRITADCPLWCPELGGEVVRMFEQSGGEFASNAHFSVDGFDTEVFSAKLLRKAAGRATEIYDRNHVTPWMYRHVGPALRYVHHVPNVGGMKLSLDTVEDLDKIRAVHRALPDSTRYGYDALTWRSTVQAFAQTTQPITQTQEEHRGEKEKGRTASRG